MSDIFNIINTVFGVFDGVLDAVRKIIFSGINFVSRSSNGLSS